MENLGYFLLVHGNGTILMAKHTAMQSLNAFRKCHSCARVLDKERALVCLGCKDGLIEVGLP